MVPLPVDAGGDGADDLAAEGAPPDGDASPVG